MAERRYTEEEVARIFERATKSQPVVRREVAPDTGMTLAELQAIGREVGIPDEAVVQAARSLDQGEQRTVRRLLGFPIGVGKTIELGRRLSDDEWDRLVVDLRETFDARGNVRSQGSLRQWTNGNLQALLEPTESGHRLRLRTTKGSARSLMTAGLATMGVSAVMMISTALSGGLGDPSSLGFISVLTIGLGVFGAGALQLPSWARLRLRQMEGVAERLARLAGRPPAPELPPDSG